MILKNGLVSVSAEKAITFFGPPEAVAAGFSLVADESADGAALSPEQPAKTPADRKLNRIDFEKERRDVMFGSLNGQGKREFLRVGQDETPTLTARKATIKGGQRNFSGSSA